MATPTYDLLESTKLASSTSSFTFSSINQTYGDLVVVFEAYGVGGNVNFNIRLNGDSGNNYNFVDASSLSGNYSGNTNDISQYGLISNAGSDINEALPVSIDLIDYTSTSKHKTCLIRDGRYSSYTDMVALRYASTSAITSITIYTGSNSYGVGSFFKLYGIAK